MTPGTTHRPVRRAKHTRQKRRKGRSEERTARETVEGVVREGVSTHRRGQEERAVGGDRWGSRLKRWAGKTAGRAREKGSRTEIEEEEVRGEDPKGDNRRSTHRSGHEEGAVGGERWGGR